MPDSNLQTEGGDARSFAGLVRRRWYAFLLVLFVPAAALAFSLAQEDKFTAKASILFRDTSALASGDPEREAASNVELLSLETIEQRVNAKLGRKATADVSFSQEGASNVLTVEATDTSPRVAARTANLYAAEYLAFRRRAELQGVRAEEQFARNELNALPAFESDSTRAQDLREDLRRLAFEARRTTGAARVVAPATRPDTRSSPKPVRNTLVGLVVGLFLAGIAALLLERFDPRLKTPKEAEAAMDTPILGMIPKSRALSSPVTGSVPTAEFDDFVALRSYLRFVGQNGDIRSVLITSASPNDGKTTVAWNLAAAAAAPGAKVALIEGDLRNPTLADALGAAPERGLADVLAGEATIEEVGQDVAVRGSNEDGAPARIVRVVVASSNGRPIADAGDWERLGPVVEQLARDYELVVIDTPPLISVPDAVPLIPHVDGVIVVGRLGNTPRAALVRLKEQLDTIGARTVGVVVNSVGRDDVYGYGYGYGSGRSA